MNTVDAPVFIGGLAHSGKTPVRLVLEKSGDIALTRKSYLWLKYFNRLGDLADPSVRANALDTLFADPAVSSLAPDAERVRRDFSTSPHSYARLFGIIQRQHAERVGKPRWGEQLGLVEAFAEPIFETFPDARIVHMIRDPRDRVGFRRFTKRGRAGWETAKWLYSAQLARDNERRHSGRYRIVRYEQLVADPESTMREICGFAELALTPPMIVALGTIANDHALVPIETKRRSFVERHTSEALADLGYSSLPSGRRGGRALTAQLPLDQLGAVAWRATKQRSLTKQIGPRP
ncbi:MAG TPA: sulfotransferase [Acidimicrobiales bacterium]|nr:sulfotransferase [Acidimicrobiales bacterium]